MNKPKIRKVYKKIIALLAIPFILTGCQSNCNIGERHVHKYIGIIRRGYKGSDKDHSIINYLDSEKGNNYREEWLEEERMSGRYYPFEILYQKQEEYITITKDDEEFYKVKGDLFNGKENWDFLYSIMARMKDYLEYYYYNSDGESTWEDWTTNAKHPDNTGDVRIRHMRFYGYKIEYKDGKYVKIKSPLADDIRDIIDEYPYFDIECYIAVYKKFKYNKKELSNIKLEDIDDYKQPDLSNKELNNNIK